MSKVIVEAMETAFFGSAWAEQAEETGNSSQLRGKEITELLPKEADPAAIHAARTLVMDIESKNDKSIEEIYKVVADRMTEKQFGFYVAMQAMGQGVGLHDYGVKREEVLVPYVEFGGHSLEKDYFQPPVAGSKSKLRP